MKIIGGFICFLALYGFGVQITLTGVLWMLFGIFFVVIPEVLRMFIPTQRVIHRSGNVKK
jgi:hypothetical protein